MNHANSILETFEYFCQITSKSIVTISSYTISKLGRFFEPQCRLCLTCVAHLQVVIAMTITGITLHTGNIWNTVSTNYRILIQNNIDCNTHRSFTLITVQQSRPQPTAMYCRVVAFIAQCPSLTAQFSFTNFQHRMSVWTGDNLAHTHTLHVTCSDGRSIDC